VAKEIRKYFGFLTLFSVMKDYLLCSQSAPFCPCRFRSYGVIFQMLPVIVLASDDFRRFTPGATVQGQYRHVTCICIEISGRTFSHFVDHRSLSGLVAGRYVTDCEPCTGSYDIASEFR
jgi:hypothetical protein